MSDSGADRQTTHSLVNYTNNPTELVSWWHLTIDNRGSVRGINIARLHVDTLELGVMIDSRMGVLPPDA